MNINSGKLVRPEEIRFVDNELFEKWMPEKLKKGDIILTSEAPLGELYFLENGNYCLSQRLFALFIVLCGSIKFFFFNFTNEITLWRFNNLCRCFINCIFFKTFILFIFGGIRYDIFKHLHSCFCLPWWNKCGFKF